MNRYVSGIAKNYAQKSVAKVEKYYFSLPGYTASFLLKIYNVIRFISFSVQSKFHKLLNLMQHRIYTVSSLSQFQGGRVKATASTPNK